MLFQAALYPPFSVLKRRDPGLQGELAAVGKDETYDRLFDYLNTNYGMAEFASITERGLRTIRNKLAATPLVADRTVDMVGMLWRYAKEHIDGMDRLGPNPAAEVAAIHTEQQAYKAWSHELCTAIERHDNPAVVRAHYLLRYTGQRISDVAPMKLSQFDGTAIEVVQEKTGTYVWLPAHEKLREHLAGHIGPCREFLGPSIRIPKPLTAYRSDVQGIGVPRLLPAWPATPCRQRARRSWLFCARDYVRTRPPYRATGHRVCEAGEPEGDGRVGGGQVGTSAEQGLTNSSD